MGVGEMKDVAVAYWKAVGEVTDWCERLSKAVGFSDCDNIALGPEEVTFTGRWYGPYQSEDYRHFSFPYHQLLLLPEFVAARITSEDVIEADQKKQSDLEECKQRRRQQFETLKREFDQ